MCATETVRVAAVLRGFQGDCGAGFGVGEGMVMLLQVIAACCCDRGQSVVGERPAEGAARGAAGTVERITGIGQSVQVESGFQAPFVERAVVRYQRQTLDKGRYFPPYFREVRGLYGIVIAEAVDAGAEFGVVVRARTYQPICLVAYLSAAHDHQADTAYARPLPVGRLEVYGCKVFHA